MRCGGSERVAVKLSQWCTKAGYNVSLVTWSSIDSDFYPIPDGVERIGLEMEAESSSLIGALFSNYKRIRAVKKIIQEHQSNYVLCFGDQCGILGVFASFGTQAKVIFSERKDPTDTPLTGIWRRLQQFTYNRAYKAVALSKGAQAALKKEYPTLSTVVIGNASSIDQPVRSSVENTVPYILFVGRLHPQKGVDVLLRALAILNAERLAFNCYIIGDGEQLQDLITLSEELALSSLVHFAGKSSNVKEWYEKADVFVLSSTHEGFPNTLIEAMSVGLPVISSKCGSAVEDIFHDEYPVGLMFPVNDSVALADALRKVITNQELRSQLKKNSYRRSLDYSEEFISGEWLKVLS